MSDDLENKAVVALNLLNQGAEEVSIVGTDIKVKRRTDPIEKIGSIPGSQLVIVNNQASAYSKVNVETHISIVREELRQIYGNGKKFKEIDSNLTDIEPELKKKNPNKSSLRNFLHWLTDFGGKALEKLAPLIIEKLAGPI